MFINKKKHRIRVKSNNVVKVELVTYHSFFVYHFWLWSSFAFNWFCNSTNRIIELRGSHKIWKWDCDLRLFYLLTFWVLFLSSLFGIRCQCSQIWSWAKILRRFDVECKFMFSITQKIFKRDALIVLDILSLNANIDIHCIFFTEVGYWLLGDRFTQVLDIVQDRNQQDAVSFKF